MRIPFVVRLLTLSFLAGSVATLGFFAWHEHFQRALVKEHGYAVAHANAAKHAYAAANIYRGLRFFLIGPETAEEAVLQLGHLTEYAETYFKISHPDSTEEMMKDLYNNQAGIAAAMQAGSARRAVLRMVDAGQLALSDREVPFMDGAQSARPVRSVAHAWAWFRQHQSQIRAVFGATDAP